MSCSCEAPKEKSLYREGGGLVTKTPLPEDQVAPPVQQWEGPLILEGEQTGDGRRIKPGALRWDTLPIPFRWAEADYGEHNGAVVVGNIASIERLTVDEANERLRALNRPTIDGRSDEVRVLWGKGEIDSEDEQALKAARHVKKGYSSGVSADLDDVLVYVDEDGEEEVLEEGRFRAATLVAIPAFEGARVALIDSETFTARLEPRRRAFNWVDDVGGLPQYIKRISKHLQKKGFTESHAIATAVNAVKKMCATGDVNFPGKQEVNVGSRAEACAAVADWERKKAQAKALRSTTAATWGRVPSLTAAATVFDGEMFKDPMLPGPTPLTVTDEGHVFGHLALWDTCHIANPAGPGRCVTPPRSKSNYAYFRRGAVSTTLGDVNVGTITLGTTHAGAKMSAYAAAQHYENTGSVAAYVNVGEDKHGIWVAGVAKPGSDYTALKAAPISGDWRTVNGAPGLEMVAALAVVVPGFPVPRPEAFVASGHVQSLVAAGTVPAVSCGCSSTTKKKERPMKETFTMRARRARKATNNPKTPLGRMYRAHQATLRFREAQRKVARARAAARVRAFRAQYTAVLTAAGNDNWKRQWRVPRGNGRISGRWIDMPNLERLLGLVDMFDTPDGDERTNRLRSAVEEAQAKAVRVQEALNALDGDRAKAAAQEVGPALDKVEDRLDEMPGDADSQATLDEMRSEVAQAREDNDIVAESDLSLLADEGIGEGEGGDIGEGEGDIGEEEAPEAPEADAEAASDALSTALFGMADQGAFTDEDAEEIGGLLAQVEDAVDAGDTQAALDALGQLDEGFAGGPQGGGFDADPGDVEVLRGLIADVQTALDPTFGEDPGDIDAPEEPETPAAADTDAHETALGDLEASLMDLADGGSLSDDLAEEIGASLEEAWGHLRDSNDEVAASSVLDTLRDYVTDSDGASPADKARIFDEIDKAQRGLGDIDEPEGGGTPDEEIANLMEGFERTYSPQPGDPTVDEVRAEVERRVADGESPADALKAVSDGIVQGRSDRASETDAEEDITAKADALEATLFDLADQGAFTDDDAEDIGAWLEGIRGYIDGGDDTGALDQLNEFEDHVRSGVQEGGPDMDPEDRDRVLSAIGDLRRSLGEGDDPGDVPEEPEPDAPSAGSVQQQNAQKVKDTASRLEATIMDVADVSELSEADAEMIGGQLDALIEQINAVMDQIRDGGSNEAALNALMGQLSAFEATLMDVADRPGLSDDQAAQIGTVLDDLFNDIGALTQSLQGEMTPPPFAARLRRSYARRTLGRRQVITLGGHSLL